MIFLRDFARRAPAWDASVKVSFALALALFVCLMALGLGGPAEIRLPARIGAFGVLITGQLLFLWGNRREISPYHQAQQRFIAGDFQAAKSILEAAPATARESVDALVLLGNTYRHLAQFDRGRAALERALALNPRHHLAHFSRGKLSLVLGDYAAARESIARALELGAPDIVRFELGQACLSCRRCRRRAPRIRRPACRFQRRAGASSAARLVSARPRRGRANRNPV